jgi:hypothetical protein
MKVDNYGTGKGPTIKTKCPVCGHAGTFESLGTDDIYIKYNGGTWFCQRRCPNDNCFSHLFAITRDNGQVISSLPSQRIDFESNGIPEKVISAFVEAITCHSSNCYTASAIMIRKTLEEVCRDRDAKGDNLKLRIQSLGSKILIPKELIEGMDELRLLGNDAAHFESQAFDKVGKEEVEIGIEFSKEILKAVYQYENLLNKLRSLKKTSI